MEEKNLPWISLQLFAEGGGDAGAGGEAAGGGDRAEVSGTSEQPVENPARPEEKPDQVARKPHGPEENPMPTAETLLRQYQYEQRLVHADRQYETWMRQAEEARRLYPGLDLRQECRNPQFLQLLQAGVDVGSAYLTRHADEVLPALMRETARIVERKLAGKLRSDGVRPAENGLRPQGASLTKVDVEKMSRTDREEIRKRAAKGERIRF